MSMILVFSAIVTGLISLILLKSGNIQIRLVDMFIIFISMVSLFVALSLVFQVFTFYEFINYICCIPEICINYVADKIAEWAEN